MLSFCEAGILVLLERLTGRRYNTRLDGAYKKTAWVFAVAFELAKQVFEPNKLGSIK
ncbi:MAG: hypothetical protein ABII13_04985 [Patescibacteria group bacterium]